MPPQSSVGPVPEPAVATGQPAPVSRRSVGDMEVFAGTGQTSLRNPALVRELLRAIK